MYVARHGAGIRVVFHQQLEFAEHGVLRNGGVRANDPLPLVVLGPAGEDARAHRQGEGLALRKPELKYLAALPVRRSGRQGLTYVTAENAARGHPPPPPYLSWL
jgi:hypothetical protein